MQKIEHSNNGNTKKISRRQGYIFRKKGKLKTFHVLDRKEIYQFYLKISKINEKVNKIFISPEMLTSYFGVKLNKRNAGQWAVFHVWLFSCHNSMRRKHIYKSNKYPSMICKIFQKQRHDRKIKTVKFLFLLSIYLLGEGLQYQFFIETT